MVPDDRILECIYTKILDGHLTFLDGGKLFIKLADKFVQVLIKFYFKVTTD